MPIDRFTLAARSVLVFTIIAFGPCLAGGRPSRTDRPTPAPSGRLHLTFAERSPLSMKDDLLRRALGDEYPADIKEAPWSYDLSAESFEAFVPRSDRSNAAMGLFVFVS